MPVGEVGPSRTPQEEKHTSTTTNPVTRYKSVRECGAPAAYPEVASCVRFPQEAESRQAPSAGHRRSLGPRRRPACPALGPPPARAPNRPSLAAACAYACARAAANLVEPLSSPPGRAPAPTANVPQWRTGAHTAVDTRQYGAPRPHAYRRRPAPARAVTPAPGPPPPHPPAPPGVPSPPSFVLPAICMRII